MHRSTAVAILIDLQPLPTPPKKENEKKERTHIRQLEAKEFAHWLKKYSTGQLWQKNVIGGRP